MRKYLFLLSALFVFVVSGCKKDPDPQKTELISNVKLPTSDPANPIVAGSLVEITGEGFTAQSEIWLRPSTKAYNDIKAQVVEFNTGGITFTAPDVDGVQGIVLKQSGQEQVLGELAFRTKIEQLYAYRLDKTDPNNEVKQVVKIDTESGAEDVVIEDLKIGEADLFSPVYVESENALFDIMSYFGTRYDLIKVNLNDKTSTIIPLNSAFRYGDLVVGDKGELIVYRYDNSNPDDRIKQIVKIDKVTGAEEIVIEDLKIDTYLDFYSPIYVNSTNELCDIDNNDFIKVDLDDNTITTTPLSGVSIGAYGDLVIVNDELYAYRRDYSDPENYIKQIVKINKDSGAEEVVIEDLKIKSTYFTSPIYLSSANELYNTDESNDLIKVSLDDKTVTEIPLSGAVFEVVYGDLVIVKE